MTQLNFTMESEEFVSLTLLPQDEAFRKLFSTLLNQVLEAECEMQLEAKRYERSDNRKGYRNGYYTRSLNTRLGEIPLKVPRIRNEPLETFLFENYQMSEVALMSALMQMVIEGVSTRKIARITQELCGTEFTKSTVSRICKKLDPEVQSFKNRELKNIYPFVFLDATYIKIREEHRVQDKALMVALAFNAEGIMEVIGFDIYDSESNISWESFVKTLKDRGLRNVDYFISDNSSSIKRALRSQYGRYKWQHCQAHLTREILDEVKNKEERKALNSELYEMFYSKEPAKARERRDIIYDKYEEKYPKAMKIMDENFEDAIRVMEIPVCEIQRRIRTTNPIERLNREIKRRTKVVGIFPDRSSDEHQRFTVNEETS